MDKAIEQAKQMGVGMVVANMTNHFSIAGHWALMAEKEGLIGMAFTNTSPKVIPGFYMSYSLIHATCKVFAARG